MKIYNYDKKTHEFLFESNAKKNPKESGNYLIPANATSIKPPKKEGDFTQIFNNNIWILEEKHVGIFYNKETLKAIITTIIGPIPKNLTTLKPATMWDKWEIDKWVTVRHIYYYKLQNKKWILDSSKKQELKQAIDNVYDIDAEDTAKKSQNNIFLNIDEDTTKDQFLGLLFDAYKNEALANKNKKNSLNSKTMQELMDIYNSITEG